MNKTESDVKWAVVTLCCIALASISAVATAAIRNQSLYHQKLVDIAAMENGYTQKVDNQGNVVWVKNEH